MNLTGLPDDWTLHANATDLSLHSVLDDLTLRAHGDGLIQMVNFVLPFYLTDPHSNRLTDPQGNYLIIYGVQNIGAQVLHTVADDFQLRAES